MEKMHLRVFQNQIALQCDFIMFAGAEINTALQSQDISRIFYAVQNFLNAGANISKTLWGGGGKKSEQRKPLRESIGVTDQSPLRAVTMRNNFEHMDDRIDQWWEKSETHNYADLNIGPVGMIGAPTAIDLFRQYDPENGNVVFWGSSFNLPEIYEEVIRMRPIVKREAAKPHWEE